MKGSKFIIDEGAYQWAESFYKQQKEQIIVDLDFEKMLELLEKGEAADHEVFFFESRFNKLPLMMMEIVLVKKKKAKVLVYKITKRSYDEFKREHCDILQVYLMYGRMAYLKEYCLGRAIPPRFVVHPSDGD